MLKKKTTTQKHKASVQHKLKSRYLRVPRKNLLNLAPLYHGNPKHSLCRRVAVGGHTAPRLEATMKTL